MSHLTIKESEDGTATIMCDSQPFLLLEPSKPPSEGEPESWFVQGIIVKGMPHNFTPSISIGRPIRLERDEYLRIGT